MTIETQLFDRLSTWPALTALLSTRVYPDQLPQGVALPAITYQRVSTVQVNAMSSDPGSKNAPFQINSWSESWIEARQIADIVGLALVGSRSQAVAPWVDAGAPVKIERAFLENDFSLPERRTDTVTYRIVQDFRIHFIE